MMTVGKWIWEVRNMKNENKGSKRIRSISNKHVS